MHGKTDSGKYTKKSAIKRYTDHGSSYSFLKCYDDCFGSSCELNKAKTTVFFFLVNMNSSE